MKFLYLIAIFTSLLGGQFSMAEPRYFPPDQGQWETTDPAELGWDTKKLQKLFRYVKKNNSSGLVILHKGKILAEKHFEVRNKDKDYLERIVGKNKSGRVIEDVASVQKSVVSILIGIAQEKGLLNINDKVSQHLGTGWSRAKLHQENKIQILHLLTMTSGLSKSGSYEKAAGNKWLYNTKTYSKLMDILVAATGTELNSLTQNWLTGPTGMQDSYWVERADGVSTNKYGFATSARDLARFGLMALANGQWKTQEIISDKNYLLDSINPSQELNPDYGYLWWVNSHKHVRKAPLDMFAAHGNLHRRVYVVPSMELVVTRIGAEPKDSKSKFDRKLWKLIMAASTN